MSCSKFVVMLVIALFSSLVSAGGTTEFCLDGDYDIGLRYQGTEPKSGEFYPATRCVISDDSSQRVAYSASGRSNPDMNDDWTVAYLPPDTVRIVNRETPPDVEFLGTNNLDEALRVRRLDPRRLLEEFSAATTALDGVHLVVRDNRVLSASMSAELPLRGRVDVEWSWDWKYPSTPTLRVTMDDELLFRATGRWRTLSDDEAAGIWQATPGADPIEVPGERWPAQVNMRTINLTDNVYLVRGVRTGFQHLVVETEEGLVVADAPAGWVEFHHIPPADLVPGLGVSGLSEKLIDYLGVEFPDRPIRAVALTHFHDDHAGGARAFAAAGAEIYATEASAEFLTTALNRSSMPRDRLSEYSKPAVVLPVNDELLIGSEPNRVKLVSMGSGPHAYAMLGIWVIDRDYFFVSDVHVPRSDADIPRGGREATECWFAEWAVRNLPPEVRVVNSHSPIVTPVARLEKYLESELCEL